MKYRGLVLVVATLFAFASCALQSVESKDGEGSATYSRAVTAPTYTITYLGNGNTSGSVPVDAARYAPGSRIVLPSPGDMTKTNAPFLCWNTSADGKGAAYLPGSVYVMGAASVVLYAYWKPGFVMKKYLRDGSLYSHLSGSWAYGLFFNRNAKYLPTPQSIHDHLFDNRTKPLIVSIHGLDWNGPLNSFNSGVSYKNWNCFSFRWADYNMLPEYGSVHGMNIFTELKDLIETYDVRNTEIRLMSHSWGAHVAAWAARNLTEYLNQKNRRILVTVSLRDPTVQWANLAQSMCANLEYVQTHQFGVSVLPNKKLFTIVVGNQFYNQYDWAQEFTRYVLNGIYSNSEFIFKDVDHSGIWAVPFDNGSVYYHKGNTMRFDDPKVDLSKTLFNGGTNIMTWDIVPGWYVNRWVKQYNTSWDGNKHLWNAVTITQ